MNEKHLDAVVDFCFDRITRDQLLKIYPISSGDLKALIQHLLENALLEKDKDEVEAGVLLGHKLGFPQSCVAPLNSLLTENWHERHEDIAWALQMLRHPSSVDALYHAALADFDYLAYDEAHALAVKCCWALGDINTAYANKKLHDLSQSESQIVAEAAKYQLDRDDRPPPSSS